MLKKFILAGAKQFCTLLTGSRLYARIHSEKFLQSGKSFISHVRTAIRFLQKLPARNWFGVTVITTAGDWANVNNPTWHLQHLQHLLLCRILFQIWIHEICPRRTLNFLHLTQTLSLLIHSSSNMTFLADLIPTGKDIEYIMTINLGLRKGVEIKHLDL